MFSMLDMINELILAIFINECNNNASLFIEVCYTLYYKNKQQTIVEHFVNWIFSEQNWLLPYKGILQIYT